MKTFVLRILDFICTRGEVKRAQDNVLNPHEGITKAHCQIEAPQPKQRGVAGNKGMLLAANGKHKVEQLKSSGKLCLPAGRTIPPLASLLPACVSHTHSTIYDFPIMKNLSFTEKTNERFQTNNKLLAPRFDVRNSLNVNNNDLTRSKRPREQNE